MALSIRHLFLTTSLSLVSYHLMNMDPGSLRARFQDLYLSCPVIKPEEESVGPSTSNPAMTDARPI